MNKYRLTFENNDMHGDSAQYTWEEEEYDYDTYEELILDYAQYIDQTAFNQNCRNVQAWKMEGIELSPDTPEVKAELESLRNQRILDKQERTEKELKEKEDKERRQYEYYLELKEKYDKK